MRVRISRVLPWPRSPSSTRSWPASSARSTSGQHRLVVAEEAGEGRLAGGQPGQQVVAHLGLDRAVLVAAVAQLAEGLDGRERSPARRYVGRQDPHALPGGARSPVTLSAPWSASTTCAPPGVLLDGSQPDHPDGGQPRAGRPGRRTGLAQVREPPADRVVQDPRCLRADRPAHRRASVPVAWWPRVPATTRRAWRSPRPCWAARPPSSCRSTRRCRRSRRPRPTAPRCSWRAPASTRRLVAAARFAEETGAVLIHPFDHADVIAGPGDRRAGDPRAVPRREDGRGVHRRRWAGVRDRCRR